jgi:hypothetical protein
MARLLLARRRGRGALANSEKYHRYYRISALIEDRPPGLRRNNMTLMWDIGLNWLHPLSILSGLAGCGTPAGLAIWVAAAPFGAKRGKTLLRDNAPESRPTDRSKDSPVRSLQPVPADSAQSHHENRQPIGC